MVDGKETSGTAGYLRLNKNCMLSMYLGYAITYAILLAAFILFMSYSKEALGDAHDAVLLVGLVGLVLILAYMLVAPPVFYSRYRYKITEDRVDVRSGILFLRHVMVPIERIHQVEVSRGPINNMLGLGHVNVTTAGGTATISYLVIEEAEKMAERLNKLVGTMIRDREST
jgi:uncharacterized protein